MTKRIWLSLILTVAVLTTLAQKQNVYFLKNDKSKAKNRESADYICIISEPDSGSTLFNINEYYPNGKMKLSGKTLRSDDDFFEGQVISFYPTGKRQQLITYKDGSVVGDCYLYYPNGKPYNVINYLHDVMTIRACYDSTGKALMTDGEGYYINFDKDFQTVLNEGNVANGKKVGVWKDYDPIDSILYTETFADGVFVTGESKDINGNKHTFGREEISASFVGGDTALNKFIIQHIKYPADAKRYNIQGKVFVKFTVDKHGALSDFKVLRDPGTGLGDEAIRVLKLSPKWIPGIKYGCPASTQFTIPVVFSLTY